MNITFLIGNGFDLNIGLKTGYIDFIREYQKEPFVFDKELPSSKELQEKAIAEFKETLLKEEQTWANAEKAFGAYTDEFGTEKNKGIAEFFTCYYSFCSSLAVYLKREDAKALNLPSRETLGVAFANAVKTYANGLLEVQKDAITLLTNNTSGEFNYQFINFNYTNTLTQFRSAAKKNVKLGTRLFKNTHYANTMGNVIHVHGTTDREMVFGVNDISQIANAALFEGQGEEYLQQFVKLKANLAYGQNTDTKAHATLKRSHVIYVYGMSMGETDGLWWGRIATLMEQNPSIILIIHAFDAPSDVRLNMKFASYSTKKKAEFLSFSSLTDSKKQEVSARIFIDRTNVFSQLNKIVENHEMSDVDVENTHGELVMT